MIYPIEGKCDKKILIVNYKRDLWAKFSVFNCIDNGKKNYDIRRKSIWNTMFFFPALPSNAIRLGKRDWPNEGGGEVVGQGG